MATLATLTVDLTANSARFRNELSKADKSARSWSSSVRSVANNAAISIGAAGTALAAAGASSAIAVKQVAESAVQLDNLARIAGMSVSEFQAAAFATSQYGVEADKLADISKDVHDKIGDFIATGGGGLADFFENVAPKIGVTAQQLQGLSGTQALGAVKAAMDAANVSAEEQVFYLEALASDASLLAPLLADNSALMNDLTGQFDGLNAGMTSLDVEMLREANKQMSLTGEAIKAAGNDIAVEMAPYISVVADKFLTAAEEAGGFGKVIGQVVEYALVPVGVLGDAIRGWQYIFKGVGLIAKETLYAAVWDVMKVDEAITDLLNKIPGVSAEYNQTLRSYTQELWASLQQSRQEMVDLVNEPLPSDSIKQFVIDVKSAATEKAADALEAAKLRDKYRELADEAAKVGKTLKETGKHTGQFDTWKTHLADLGNEMKNLENAAVGWTNSFTDAMTGMVMTGKLNFSSLAESIISDLIRIQVQSQITAPLSQALGGFFGGLFPGDTAGAGTRAAGAATQGAGVPGVQLHTGGIVGLEGQPRWLGSDEVPAVLRKGEGVFTEGQMKNMSPADAGSWVVNIFNENGSKVETKERTGGDGMKQLDIYVRDAVRRTVNDDVANGKGLAGTLEGFYGLSRSSF